MKKQEKKENKQQEEKQNAQERTRAAAGCRKEDGDEEDEEEAMLGNASGGDVCGGDIVQELEAAMPVMRARRCHQIPLFQQQVSQAGQYSSHLLLRSALLPLPPLHQALHLPLQLPPAIT
jgi:hypothetical protein